MILGIVGSPRKGKLTDQLITRCLKGAESVGVEIEKVYLVDSKIQCFTQQTKCSEELNNLWKQADALVIGAPVYWGGINGLTKDFMDIVEIIDVNGKYGIGMSVAGGTGRGLCSALQNIYRFFYHRQIRAIDPAPVSRFNFKEILETIYDSGRRLAELSKDRKPFEGDKDRMEYYEKLEYLNYAFLDEMLLLARQLIKISKDKATFQKAKQEYETAESLIDQGKRQEAIEYAVNTYRMLYFDPPKS
jgi:multimeric flavodoxin WrbA